MEENMFSKSYDWACTLLWTSICLTLLILGWSVLYAPYWWSLTVVAVLLALFIIIGYIQYTKVLSLKRKFIIVQETFTTVMIVYFAFYYFAGENKMPGEAVLHKARKKIDDVYEASRYHLTMPLVMTALKTFFEIKTIKNAIKTEVKNFSSTDGFSVENAQIIAKELSELLQKVKQLFEVVFDAFPIKKEMHNMMTENVDDTIRKGKIVRSNVDKHTETNVNDIKTIIQSKTRKNNKILNKSVKNTCHRIQKKLS